MRPARAVLTIAFALAAMLVLALGACGKTTVVREPSVVVTSGEAGSGAPQPPREAAGVRIAVVTHGQASSPFWAIVRNGVEAAARQMDVVVDYRAPDVYSVARMTTLIDQAVATRPDGLVVSIPEPAVAPAIRRATRSGIPVVSINSGAEVYRRLGVLAHVGQPEDRAGLQAGRRLAAAGVRRALCVNQQVGATALDERCRGLARAMRRAGGTARVLGVDDENPATPRRIAAAIAAGRIDGVLALNSTSGMEAVEAAGRLRRRAGRLRIATFDLGPDVLAAVRARKLLFAVDQQAYLQGYLPIVLLAQRIRYGLFPAQGDVIPTGPNFVTAATAAKAIELSKRSIR
ncbi:MAG: simple sugar transport system substrate-binding protein [Solirubrobacteraceae bacterium]|nr:simple sugar transport system substrate-binding protein [Solirubrobacteraceae bacterium]